MIVRGEFEVTYRYSAREELMDRLNARLKGQKLNPVVNRWYWRFG